MAQLPQSIAHFQVLSELGRGGMGVVYKVKDTRTGALAALKMIPPESLGRAESELRFKREFRAMQRVEHPNVIRVFDSGTHEGCPYFTMELVEGSEIRRYVDGETPIVPNGKDGPPAILTPGQIERLNVPQRVKTVADLIAQVGFALAEIHSHRIVHRDLKPDNILVTKSGVAKLMDFGIAKQLSNTNEHSSGGMVVGTFKYLSPEQALGGDIDGRADLYCLGIILYELLTGRHPFYSENSVGYAYHHAKKIPPALDKLNPGVHPGLKGICERLTKKDPRERFATAEDLVAAVREAVGDGPAPPESTTRLPVRNLPFELAKDQVFAPALIGRDTEKRQIVAAAESLLVGQGSLVVVNGRPGIGKTRLIREAAAELKAKDIDFVWGRCTAQGGSYHPYLEALASMLDEVRDLPPNELRRLLGDDGRVLARYLPAFEQLDPSVRPRPAKALEPQGERLRFLAAATSFIGRMSATTARVIVIDDLHLADELSLSLTRHLIEMLVRGEGESGNVRAAPVTLVVTFDPAHERAADVAPLLSPAGSAHPLVTIGLGPLSTAPVRELLASMLGGGDIAQDIAEFLQQDAAGVPGLIEERVRAWVESGELRRSGRGRQWVFVKGAQGGAAAPVVVDVRSATRGDIPISDFEQSPSTKRVARLSGVARDVAERAAILGDRMAAPLLERASLRPQDEFIDALDELIKREILAEDAGGAAFRFVDLDDRKALLVALDEERRASLHTLAARAVIDDARRHQRVVNPEELARHYLEAKDNVAAIEQLMIAARTALQASATQTATQRVREAQELLGAEQKRSSDQHTVGDRRLARADVELVLLRLDVLMAVNEHRECVALAQRRLPKMEGTVDGTLVAETLLRLAASERILGNLDAALEHTGHVLSRTERGGSHALRCRAKSLCGQIYEQRGQFDVAARYFTDALKLARTIGDELEEERARCAIAERRMTAGELDEAQREFDLLLQQATARGEKLRVSHYVYALASIALERGQAEQAEAGFRRVIDLAKPAGDRRSLALALSAMSVLRQDAGNFDDALTFAAKAARILADLDQSETLAAVRIVEAQILLDRRAGDDVEGALKKADEAVALGMQARAALKVAEAEMCRGLALMVSGTSTGRGDIDRGLKTALQANANRVILFGLLVDAEGHTVIGEAQEAQRSCEAGRERAARTGSARFERKFAALKRRLRI